MPSPLQDDKPEPRADDEYPAVNDGQDLECGQETGLTVPEGHDGGVQTEASEPVPLSSGEEAGETQSDDEALQSDPEVAGALEEPFANQPFYHLTLAELIAQWVKAPSRTWRQFKRAILSPVPRAPGALVIGTQTVAPALSMETDAPRFRAFREFPGNLLQLKYAQLLLYLAAIVAALLGSAIVRGTPDIPHSGDYTLNLGAPYLFLGFFLWLAAEVVGHSTPLRNHWQRINSLTRLRWILRIIPALLAIHATHMLATSMSAPKDLAVGVAITALSRFVAAGIAWLVIELIHWRLAQRIGVAGVADVESHTPDDATRQIASRSPLQRPAWQDLSRLRLLLPVLAAACSVGVWINTTGNRIYPPIIVLWLVSLILWALCFVPLRWNFFEWAVETIDKFRRIRWRRYTWVLVAMTLVMALAYSFRFDRLDAFPSQMHSDMVEKIQDAYRIYHHDDYRIFMANIGGREPLHFYFLSILASQPGMNFDAFALKLMGTLESLVTVPLMFWLGVQVFGGRRRRFALLFGVLTAGLVAVSFWHTMLGRQAMRIALSPLFTAVTAIHFVRALRYNRRSDFVKAGLALGFGLLSYQALRMLPVVLVVAVLITLLLRKYSWRARLTYLTNLVVLAFVSLMVFLPLLHYWVEFPGSFMRRASTRIFGDLPTDAEERARILLEGGGTLLHNIRSALLQYHFTSDSTWVSAAPGEPAMDTITAAFLILGVAAWLALLVKKRDPVNWFIPALAFFMLMISTPAISFPAEVPSLIRSSGAIPGSYLIAALPLAVFAMHLIRVFPKVLGYILAVGFATTVLLAANQYNTHVYFDKFNMSYTRSAHVHAQAGDFLRGFAESDGAYGNAVIVATSHWWDHRAVGIEGGVMFWESISNINAIPSKLRDNYQRSDQFKLNPERDLLFFYAPHDDGALAHLSSWFPNGQAHTITTEPLYRTFNVYRVPALGEAALLTFLQSNT